MKNLSTLIPIASLVVGKVGLAINNIRQCMNSKRLKFKLEGVENKLDTIIENNIDLLKEIKARTSPEVFKKYLKINGKDGKTMLSERMGFSINKQRATKAKFGKRRILSIFQNRR